jgi:hypothetical protein
MNGRLRDMFVPCSRYSATVSVLKATGYVREIRK